MAVTLIGGPTVILELGGLRLLTDPTFDPPGTYEPRPGVRLRKTAPPALAQAEAGHIDLVLLSHDHHKDNLDDAGRAYLSSVRSILTTVSGAARLGPPSRALANWESVDVPRPDGSCLTVTGVPAQHGPDGSDELVGEVTGFLLTGPGVPSVYVSGDNASLGVIETIAQRTGNIDIAILFAGGAQMPYLGDAHLTLPSSKAPEAARILGVEHVVPVHLDSWEHFTDDRESLLDAFRQAGQQELLAAPRRGETVLLGARRTP